MPKSILLLISTFLFFQTALISQHHSDSDERAQHLKYADFILLENLKHHVHALAADSMQGRDTGEPGGIMAGNYIERHLIDTGIPAIGDTTYRQTMRVDWLRWEENEIRINDSIIMRNRWEYLAIPKDNKTMENWSISELVITDPSFTKEIVDNFSSDNSGQKALLIFQTEEFPFLSAEQMILAGESGIDLIIFVEEELRNFMMSNWRSLVRPLRPGTPTEPKKGQPNIIHVSSSFAGKLVPELFEDLSEDDSFKVLEEEFNGKSYSINLSINLIKEHILIEDDNILGFIEGTDPEKKHELIVLSAHYDHIGYNEDEIFYGANDNASGTAAVMEMARAFQIAKENGDGPKRSVLAILLTGEERGLLGSAFYVENPVFPLENTIANINIDMLGRVDAKHEELGINKYIYPIGSDRLSTELHDILLEVNEKYSNIHLDFTYNDPADPNRYYFRSDHYNFARKGIPAIFFFNGLNEDYHKSTDTPDKIDYESMTAVTRHIFQLAWELANREEAIEADLWEGE